MLKTFPPNAQRGRLPKGRTSVDMTFYPFAVWVCQGLSSGLGDYVDYVNGNASPGMDWFQGLSGDDQNRTFDFCSTFCDGGDDLGFV